MARTYRAAWLGAVLGCALGVGLAAAASAVETQRDGVVTRVIDGDTFEIAGGAKVRVRNFDTPELRSYECSSEREKAVAARDAARRLLQGERVRLRIHDHDRYGRLVADVAVRRRDGEHDFVLDMIEGGHGAPWNYGHEPQPQWCSDAELAAAGEAETGEEDTEALIEDLERIEKAARDAGRLARTIDRIAGWFGW